MQEINISKLRVKVSYDNDYEEYELNVQKKFFFFWFNVGFYVCVKESRCINSKYFHKVPFTRHRFTKDLELYQIGELDIEKRSLELLDEYIEYKKEEYEKINKAKLTSTIYKLKNARD